MPAPSPTVPASFPASAVEPHPQEVREVLHRLLVDELGKEGPFEDDAHLIEGLALDSLELTVIAVGLENRFRIRLSEEDAGGIRTLGELVALVVRRATEGDAR